MSVFVTRHAARIGFKDNAVLTRPSLSVDGLNMAVGLSNGEVLVYDIRACRPSLVKDHQYGFPIKVRRLAGFLFLFNFIGSPVWRCFVQ
jgi:hypothetical protein